MDVPFFDPTGQTLASRYNRQESVPSPNQGNKSQVKSFLFFSFVQIAFSSFNPTDRLRYKVSKYFKPTLKSIVWKIVL